MMDVGMSSSKYSKIEWYDIYKSEEIKRLEAEIKWLRRELKETYKELKEEREKRKLLENILNKLSIKDVEFSSIHYSEIPKAEYIDDPTLHWEKSEKLEKAKKEIEYLRKKIEKGENLSKNELRKLVEIDILSEKYPELKKIIKEVIIILEKISPVEVVELKEGEIKEIDENTLIRKRRDGVVEVIIL